MNKNNQVTIITDVRFDAIHICNQSLIDCLRQSGVETNVISLNNKLFRNSVLNFILEIFNTFKIIFMVNRNDLVLFTDPLLFNLLASTLISNKCYTIFYHYEKDPFYYKLIPFISYKTILDKLDGIICISKFTQSQLKSLGVSSQHKVIYYGIDHKLFKPTPSPRYVYDYILSVGSEEPRKNMKTILRSFQILKKDFPNLKLLKIGYVSPENRKRTIYYVNKYHLSESVIFLDYLDGNELPNIYSRAKLLLFPSLLEGFGLPIIEAMACGCPVVTSNRNPMKEIVGEVQTVINPLKPREIARLCQKILLNTKYRSQLTKKGLQRAKLFNWDKTAKEIYRFISQ